MNGRRTPTGGSYATFAAIGKCSTTCAGRLNRRGVDAELAEHDRLTAPVLGLSHALSIVFFTALADSGVAAERLARILSTTYAKCSSR